jgi:hypothetical protein
MTTILHEKKNFNLTCINEATKLQNSSSAVNMADIEVEKDISGLMSQVTLDDKLEKIRTHKSSGLAHQKHVGSKNHQIGYVNITNNLLALRDLVCY